MSIFYVVQKKGMLYSFKNIVEKQIYEDIIYTGELTKVNKKIERYLKRFKDVNDFNSLRTANVDCNFFISKSIYYGNYLTTISKLNVDGYANHYHNNNKNEYIGKKIEVSKEEDIINTKFKRNAKHNSNKGQVNERIKFLYNNQIKLIKLMIFLYYNFNIRKKSIEYSIPIILNYKVLHVNNITNIHQKLNNNDNHSHDHNQDQDQSDCHDHNVNSILFKNLIDYKNNVISFSNFKSTASNNNLELILLKYQCGL